ncbi:unnamed protein product, partial [Prorocentrum cordatum]
TRGGLVLTERCFARSGGGSYGAVECRVVLMPMVHVAVRSLFEATLRSERFARFQVVLHEGPAPGCTQEEGERSWRFVRSLHSASPLALLLELSWHVFLAGPLAASNALCRRVGCEPLGMQPEPLCPVGKTGHEQNFVATDSASLGETLLVMVSFGGSRAFSAVVPWGVAHMAHIEQGIVELGFEEVQEEAQEHLACSWGACVCAHLFV